MEKNLPHLLVDLFLAPIRVLGAQAGGIHLARGPVELFRESQPFFAGDRP